MYSEAELEQNKEEWHEQFILRNTFHNTEVKTRKTSGERHEIEERAYRGDMEAKRIMRRIWKKLCGVEDCICSNSWGERD